MKYKVLHDFRDLEDDKKLYKKGDSFPNPANKKVSKKRIEELTGKKNNAKKPMIEEVKEQD